MFDGPLDDRLAIRERIESYADAVFRRDGDAWIANWREDGVWRVGGVELCGKAQIRSAWIEAMGAYAVTAFFSTPGAIEINGAEAAARVYTREILVDHGGKVVKVIGAYDDRLVKEGRGWLFAYRSYTVLHQEADIA